MKTAIMQPYLFPYIGYFQLIHAADTFILHDDVQYIKGGWINRNRILLNKKDYLYTFSLQSDSSSKNINQRYFTPDFNQQCQKFLRVLQTAYGNAPYFERTKQMVTDIFDVMNTPDVDENIAAKIGRSISFIAEFLNLETNFINSSDLDKDEDKTSEARVIAINKRLESDMYINPIGGKKLYAQSTFRREKIKLRFLKPQKVSYPQFSNEFIPWLSIIDVCMFNSREKMGELLESYSLVQ